MNSPFYHLSHRSSVKALHTGWTPTEFVQWFWRIHEEVVYNIVDLSWLYHLFEENKCCAERRLLEKTNSEQCTRELSSLPHWPAVDPHVVSIVVAYPRTVNHQEVPNLEMTIPYCNNESSPSRETRQDTSVCRWSWIMSDLTVTWMNDNFTSSAAFLLQKMRQSIALGGENWRLGRKFWSCPWGSTGNITLTPDQYVYWLPILRIVLSCNTS